MFVCFLAASPDTAAAEGKRKMTPTQPRPSVVERIVVDQIWSAVSVGFCLLTHGNDQYIAYYNAKRRMVVGQRRLSERSFRLTTLSSLSEAPPNGRGDSSTVQGWDSHNSITMTVDAAGHLHLSGNMHCNALTYFRSRKPGDASTLEQVVAQVGTQEDRCTYPKFMNGPDGRLIFHYRDGSSGNGDEIYNIYDTRSQTWSRFLDKPLIAGLGQRNAYQVGPMRGPDGWYHLAWVWRETPDCATNHDPSYARSRDLIDWENAAGEALMLPITIDNKGTLIDAVPVQGGIINGGLKLGFDSANKVVASYHKFDKAGNTQIYAARFTGGKWVSRQVSEWDHRCEFSGGGALPSVGISVDAVKPHGKGKLSLSYGHEKYGGGLLILNEKDLAPLGTEKKTPRIPPELGELNSDFPEMRVNWTEDSGDNNDPSARYVLRWETLPPHRDRPRTGPLPEPGDLVLYKIKSQQSTARPSQH